MPLDEALAVHAYLKHRPPGSLAPSEQEAFALAWKAICEEAEKTISRLR